MQFSIMPLWTAPLTAGHPLGLPSARKADTHSKVVETARKSRQDANTSQRQTPAQFWRAMNGEPDPDHVAPPSITQMKIAQMRAGEAEAKHANLERAEAGYGLSASFVPKPEPAG